MALRTVAELRKLWADEKEQYKTAEIGSGVQKFVKSAFACDSLFNLGEGKLSTDDLKRKYEFIEEGRNKGRRADVVIFIDSDVVVPVEIEKYGDIKAGISQIFQYQADWVKKYGLLTDGNEWRFYNNNIVEKVFYISDMLTDPSNFLAFWREYTTPDHYYRSFFEKRGRKDAAEFPPAHLDEAREDFFLDITKLIENFKNKLNLKGYFKQARDDTDRNKKAVEITYAYLIQFILYKTLVDNSFSDFEDDWNERLKSIDKAIKAEAYDGILNKIRGISQKISDNIYRRFNDEQEMINEKLSEILKKPKQDISDVSVWLDILLFINRYDFSNVKNEIFGYVYENYLKDLYLDEKKGQYFTDPHIVEFMLNEIGYTSDLLQKRFQKDNDSISIVDPSCGSGTFLYNATQRLVEAFFEHTARTEGHSNKAEQVINENIVGLDIAEFPLYLAEMNILMRMLPIVVNQKYNNPVDQKIKVFKTRDSVSEFLDTALRNTMADLNTAYKKGDIQLDLFANDLDLGYKSFMRDYDDLDNLKQSLENRNKKPRYRFDFVIGNPPYVSYNECASQNLLFFKLIREGKVKLSEVYGVNLHSVEHNRKKYPPKPNLYSFFIALGLGLLKDDGKISYIIPQTIITESDYDVIRWHLSKFTIIEKIFIFENPMFLGRGIKQNNTVATSSLIFVIRKGIPSYSHKVQVYNYERHEDDIQDLLKSIKDKRRARQFEIKQSVLLKNYLNWIVLKLDSETIDLYDEYCSTNDNLSYYFEHRLARERFGSEFYFDVGFILDKSHTLKRPVKGDEFELIDLKNFKGYSSFHPQDYYPNDLRLVGLPKNCQGHVSLSKKYKLIWGKAYSSRFYFTDRNVLPSMSYTQFISSDNREELLYLFALLNSRLNGYIFHKLFQLGNEKIGIFVVVKRIKEFLKIPVIDKKNVSIKNCIISSATELVEMEKQVLSNIVDFSGVLLQKFDRIDVAGEHLVVKYKGKSVRCRVLKDIDSVKKITQMTALHGLLSNDGIGNVGELKSLSSFDSEEQAKLKNYIDDLIYSLYLRIDLSMVDYHDKTDVHRACVEDRYYKLVNS